MDQVKIKVFKSPVFQLFLADGLDVLLRVVRIPQLFCSLGHGHRGAQTDAYLASDEHIFTFDKALFDSLLQTLADLYFIAIVACSIKMSVADFDSLVDRLCADGSIKLPRSHTDLWHLLAGRVKGNGWRRHGQEDGCLTGSENFGMAQTVYPICLI